MQRDKCPLWFMQSYISNKWMTCIIDELQVERKRFSQLQKSFDGISKKVLSETLKIMEQDGTIKRIDYETKSPHVEYYLTDLGKSLVPIVNQMKSWGNENMQSILGTGN